MTSNTKDKYLSIITNFGCHYQCPYCVVKENGINVPETTLDSLETLLKCIEDVGANIISISGGGDLLYNYEQHTDYYDKLFRICYNRNIPIEMHTSYISSQFPYNRCKRIVYHLNHTEQLQKVKRYGNEIIRAVFVVTGEYSEERIKQIAEYVSQSNIIDELSFRQMVDNNYQPKFYHHDFLIRGHSEGYWHYIMQNDYNTYFVEGNLYYKFSDIGLNNSK